jgi:hypothetical protein
MAAATVLAFMATPPTKLFVENITSRALWTELHQRLVPQGHRWFEGMAWVLEGPPARGRANTLPAVTAPMATGSIVSPPIGEAPQKPAESAATR